MSRLSTLFLLIIFLLPISLLAQENKRYMEPANELLEIIDAPLTPSLSTNSTKTHVLFAYPQDMPDIKDLAQPELRLAGIRINPENFGASKPQFWSRITLRGIDDKEEYPITGLPENGNIRLFRWSPDGTKVAIVTYLPQTIELWVANVDEGEAKRWATNLNDALVSTPIDWAPDSKSILYSSRILSREDYVIDEQSPQGPAIQESNKEKSAVRTYQDLLQNPMDERRFEHYTTSQIMRTSGEKNQSPIGNPGIFTNFSASPNGEYILIQKITRPFSYIVPYYRFPIWVNIWDKNGVLIKKLSETELAENIPQGFSATRVGPRSHHWRSDKPATVVWVEAKDEGDPKKVAEIRDILYSLNAPFRTKPTAIVSLSNRYAGVNWGWNNLAVVYERWWDTRRMVVSFFNPSNPSEEKQVVWDRSWQDAYNNPGSFITEYNQQGFRVLKTNNTRSKLYLSGRGSSPEGDMPFLDEIYIESKNTKRLWQCESPYYETLITLLDNEPRKILTRRESETEQPNYFIRDLKRRKPKQFTSFPHPFPQLKDVEKEMVRYKREDGVELTANLYLPANYKKGSEKLPVLMWAYPREYVDPKLAAQVTGSPYRFIRPSRLSPIMWVARGYAVLDRVGMPVIGQDSLLPNDTFVEQLIANAKAAINFLEEQGIADSSRIAIGGHSYGAFMTANLLAHSNLFAAGIARSGAYNRTLTPFGFQGEERTYWEAPEVYLKMSPFMQAHKIETPMLLIHGEDDNNSGTYPMQSERMYQAINGNGGTARLVMLPFEKHGYRARQSILHQTWEIDRWLEKYLK
ncbi:MAG: S9 family peptidase [Bacteroidales bacterium]